MKLTFRPVVLLVVAIAIIIAAIPIGKAAYHWSLNAYPVPKVKLEKIRGMEKEEVAQLLGRPTVILDGGAWQYHKIYCLQAIEVVFDRDGKCINWHWE